MAKVAARNEHLQKGDVDFSSNQYRKFDSMMLNATTYSVGGNSPSLDRGKVTFMLIVPPVCYQPD